MSQEVTKNIDIDKHDVIVALAPVTVDKILETKVENVISEKEAVEGPFEPGPNMLDTAKDYLVKKVNYGGSERMPGTLSDGTKFEFSDNKLTTSKRIDERNLSKCLMLNLMDSTVESL